MVSRNSHYDYDRRHSGGERVGQTLSRFIFKVSDFINEALVESVLSREPGTKFHQGEPAFNLALAAFVIEQGAVKVELVKISLNLLAIGNELRELVGVETAPFEESREALMHEVHSTDIHGCVFSTGRSDGDC